jgi:xylulokinase
MPIVLGLDSSTQSISGLLLDTERGEILHTEVVHFGTDLPHFQAPSGFIPGGAEGEVHADPLMWLEALDLLFSRLQGEGIDLGSIAALSGSGQQHGSVYLNAEFSAVVGNLRAESSLAAQIAPCLTRASSPIWMDGSTSEECAEIAKAMGGGEVVCSRSGSIPVERFTGPQIRRFSKEDPEAWQETGVVHLVSSFLCSVLAGGSAAMDVGDGAGMNLMNLANSAWDEKLVEATASNLMAKLPAVLPSGTVAGEVSSYFVSKYGLSPSCQVVLFSGDNPCSLVGMGAASPGKVVISLGTSDTLFAAMPDPRTDPNGYGHVFGNPMGGYMSLLCFKNGSLAREALKAELGLSWEDFDLERLDKTPLGNGGRVMIPFFESEITPRVESDGPEYRNWPEGERGKGESVRALLEGQFANMWLQSRWLGIEPESIFLTGGASENDGIAQVVADVFGVPVVRLKVTASAALGAAMRAAVATDLASLAELEAVFCLPEPDSKREPQAGSAEICARLRDAYAQALHETFPSLEN